MRLVRRHVDVESITRAKIVDPAEGIGYVQLSGFQKTSTEELDQAISGLQALGMRTLVLDLRGNPGGLLNVAVEIAERFIDDGVIVSTRGRASGQSQVLRAGGQARWRMPMYLLVDHDSASASEILAGALQDHRRATVIGERTYGKGSVQSIFSLRSAPAGLKLTTAKFYSPKNRPYSEQGVTPDLPIKTRVAAKPAGNDKDAEPLDESDHRRPQARPRPRRRHPRRPEPQPGGAVSAISCTLRSDRQKSPCFARHPPPIGGSGPAQPHRRQSRNSSAKISTGLRGATRGGYRLAPG